MTPQMKKLASILLLVLTFVTIFTPWTLNEELKEEVGYVDIDYYGTSYFEEYGVSGRRLQQTIKRVADGISPGDLNYTLGTFGKLLRALEKQYKEYQQEYGPYWSDMDLSDMLSYEFGIDINVGAIKAYRFFYWVLMAVTFAALLHAALSHLMDRKYSGWGVLACVAALLVIFIVLTVKLNDLTYEDTFKLTAWPFLALVFAAGSVGMWMWYGRGRGYNTQPLVVGAAATAGRAGIGSVLDGIGGWTCAVCNTRNAQGSIVCVKCGTAKPQPKVCGYCGNRLAPDMVFCGNCGKMYIAPKSCPVCHAQMPGDAAICGHCGTVV